MTDPLLNPNKDVEVMRFKRHPFGIWLLYVSYVLGFTSVILIIKLALPELDIKLSGEQLALIYAGVAAAAILAFLLLIVARYIYWCSEMCITESAVSEIVQYGLFSKHIARLDMEKIEDVTAQQKGFMPTMFNFGTLLIETAGEVENFVFIYCPRPNETAQAIHSARQKYLDRRMHETAETHAYTFQQQYAPAPMPQPFSGPVQPEAQQSQPYATYQQQSQPVSPMPSQQAGPAPEAVAGTPQVTADTDVRQSEPNRQ